MRLGGEARQDLRGARAGALDQRERDVPGSVRVGLERFAPAGRGVAGVFLRLGDGHADLAGFDVRLVDHPAQGHGHVRLGILTLHLLVLE